MLCPAHGRVGRANLVLRHSVPNFLGALRVKRRTLPLHQSEEIKILHISFPRVGIEPTTFF